ASSFFSELAVWNEKAKHDASLHLVAKDIKESQKKVDEAVELIKEKLIPALAAGKKIVDIETTLYVLHDEVENFLQKAGGIRLEQTSSSIFSTDFYAQLDKNLWQTTLQNITAVIALQKKIFADHVKSLFALFLSTFFLTIIIRYSKKPIKGSAPWHSFTERPVCAAFFVSLAIFTLIEVFSHGVFLIPQGWETIKAITIISVSIPLIRVLLVATPWKRRFFCQLAVAILILLLFRLVNLPLPFVYIFLYFILPIGFFFYLWQSYKLSRKNETTFGVWSLRLCSLFLLFLVILIGSGFGDLALYLLDSLLATGAFAVAYWMFFLVTCGAFDALLSLYPDTIADRNSHAIISSITPVLITFYGLIFLVSTLQVWGIYPTIEAGWTGLKALHLKIGAWHIKTEFVLTAAVSVYIVMLISKTVKSILLQDVLPRKSMELGTQISIVRLVNYFILVLGFMMVAYLLGFDLTHLTIFGGALGIGLGFGLKEIINNIASGLILLFERPIKIGDIIALGDEIGVVKKMGLRATVVKTLNSAEIVVPNADFITGQVTNWTLDDRQIRIKIPVGVAYGSDIEKVFSILLSCAEENPLVLSEPKARALFLSFGDSSLDFELRVWIHDFTERRTVLSELNNDINNEFDMAGIEIPFPQRDLHLRSSSVDNIVDSPSADLTPKPSD
ncbi:MAG: mechanosensitive ion channel, partial [Desulfobulbaceae bacterium]|nr:mechanosensitive ion channel [Desulfobulbaceae bacterium]